MWSCVRLLLLEYIGSIPILDNREHGIKSLISLVGKRPTEERRIETGTRYIPRYIWSRGSHLDREIAGSKPASDTNIVIES